MENVMKYINKHGAVKKIITLFAYHQKQIFSHEIFLRYTCEDPPRCPNTVSCLKINISKYLQKSYFLKNL